MRGSHKGRIGEPEGDSQSRHLTPSIGLARNSGRNDDAANEDFLFHLYRGSELLQDNRAHEAKVDLERALHLQPHDAKGQALLAVVYFRLGLYPWAISIYEELRRTSPRDPALLLNLALCYLKTGQALIARRDLEVFLTMNPAHARAWGYLGLACERMGALDDAQRAFEQGGHGPMARRMAERRASRSPSPPLLGESSSSREVHEVIAAAYEELDGGALSIALAESVSDSAGDLTDLDADDDIEPESKGRHTLMVGVAPPHDPADAARISAFPSASPPSPPGSPSFVIDAAEAPLRGSPPVMRIPRVLAPDDSGLPHDVAKYGASDPPSKRTMAPPPPRLRPVSSSPRAMASVPLAVLPPIATAPPLAAQLTRDSTVSFPLRGTVVIHPSGVALVRTASATGFAARLEALRASSNALSMKVLERQVKGTSTGEPFGGAGSPLVHATGEGRLVLAPRAGRTLSSFKLDGDMCFVREEVLLGFDGELAFENGRLATGEGDFVAVVQLRGKGVVLFEAIGDVLTLEVVGNRGLSVRREVVLGWFGRLVPRALAPNEAPCGQHGLLSFAGQGQVLVASA